MGWSSGGDVFDPVAETLREMDGIPEQDRTLICVALIKALQGNDWDTEDESLEHFRHTKFVTDAFAEAGVHPPEYETLRRYLRDNFSLAPDEARDVASVLLPVVITAVSKATAREHDG